MQQFALSKQRNCKLLKQKLNLINKKFFFKCLIENFKAKCICLPQYTGSICSFPNDCYSNPCGLGFTCVSLNLGGFNCLCNLANCSSAATSVTVTKSSNTFILLIIDLNTVESTYKQLHRKFKIGCLYARLF